MLRVRYTAAVAAACLLSGVVAAQTNTIKGWGEIVDPDRDCTIREAAGKVTITVPGTPHDLSQFYPKKNAPRVLQEVDGDFVVRVKVSGDFDPGNVAAEAGKAPFNSAGLIVWNNEQNLVRLERNIWLTPQGQAMCYPPLFEYWKNGKTANMPPQGTLQPFFQGRSTYLGLQRQGNQLLPAVSHDGRQWIKGNAITVDMPAKVKVGVIAVNTSRKPLTVDFEELKLTAK